MMDDCLTAAVTKLKVKWATSFVDYELKKLDEESQRIFDNDQSKEISEYFKSTSNRRAFGLTMVAAKLHSTPALATDVAHSIRVSRTALDKMISECEDAGWIEVTRNAHGWRYIHATQVAVDSWMSYADARRLTFAHSHLIPLSMAIEEINKAT